MKVELGTKEDSLSQLLVWEELVPPSKKMISRILAVVSTEIHFSSSVNDRYNAMLTNKADPDLQMPPL